MYTIRAFDAHARRWWFQSMECMVKLYNKVWSWCIQKIPKVWQSKVSVLLNSYFESVKGKVSAIIPDPQNVGIPHRMQVWRISLVTSHKHALVGYKSQTRLEDFWVAGLIIYFVSLNKNTKYSED